MSTDVSASFTCTDATSGVRECRADGTTTSINTVFFDTAHSLDVSETLLERLARINKGHACNLVEKTRASSIKVHFFYGELDDHSIGEFFLNNTNVMRYFCRYVNKELEPKLNSIEPYPFAPQSSSNVKSFIDSLRPITRPTYEFILSLAPNKKLSPKQWEIIHWYLMGKTAEETAMILGVKASTVESYFIRIKQKLGCATKPQIISELFNHSDFWAEYGAAFSNNDYWPR